MRGIKRALLASAAIALSAGTARAEAAYSVATGLDFSSGDYGGATDTEVVSAPLVLRVTNGSWSFRASTSYLQIDGPADVADVDAGAGDGTSGTGGTGGTIVRTSAERGISDTNLSLSRTFRRIGGSDGYFETTARVRLPTGDEEAGLGVSGRLTISSPAKSASTNAAAAFPLNSREDSSAIEPAWNAKTAGKSRPTHGSALASTLKWALSAHGGKQPSRATMTPHKSALSCRIRSRQAFACQ